MGGVYKCIGGPAKPERIPEGVEQRAAHRSWQKRQVSKFENKSRKLRKISKRELLKVRLPPRELVKWMKEEWESAGIETVSNSKLSSSSLLSLSSSNSENHRKPS